MFDQRIYVLCTSDFTYHASVFVMCPCILANSSQKLDVKRAYASGPQPQFFTAFEKPSAGGFILYTTIRHGNSGPGQWGWMPRYFTDPDLVSA